MAEGVVVIERLGGFAGFGLPGSHLKSKGQLSMGRLSPEEAHAIDQLFAGHFNQSPATADRFVYRMTRSVDNVTQTIMVPEESVPQFVRDSVHDTLE